MFSIYPSNAEVDYRRERISSAFRRADRDKRRTRTRHHHLPRRKQAGES
jgi:hypothetical protein